MSKMNLGTKDHQLGIDPVLDEIGKLVRYTMQRKGLGVMEVSRKAKLNPYSIYKVMRGDYYTMTTLLEILNVLDLTLQVKKKIDKK